MSQVFLIEQKNDQGDILYSYGTAKNITELLEQFQTALTPKGNGYYTARTGGEEGINWTVFITKMTGERLAPLPESTWGEGK
jgi:hypothetical protein